MAASYFNCPVWVAIQAKQMLNNGSTSWMMPGIYDGEESSSIAQRLDRIITLWLPKMTNSVGSMITNNGLSVTVTEDLLLVKVAKQRGNLPSGRTYKCSVDYVKNTIRVVE